MLRRERSWFWLGSVVICLLLVWYFLLERPVRRTYQNYVALDGTGPVGPIYSPNPPYQVSLYRRMPSGTICYDVFYSKDLHDRLAPRNGQLVTAEYDTFRNFGRVYGYNVHSVNGFMLANGDWILRTESYGVNGVMRFGNGTASRNECW